MVSGLAWLAGMKRRAAWSSKMAVFRVFVQGFGALGFRA